MLEVPQNSTSRLSQTSMLADIEEEVGDSFNYTKQSGLSVGFSKWGS